MAYPRHRLARAHKRAVRTSGNITLNATAITDVDIGLDIVLAAQVGDCIEYGISGLVSNVAQSVGFDVYTIVGGSPVNPLGPGLSASLASLQGISMYFCDAIAQNLNFGGGYMGQPLVSGDISSNTVTLRLRYAKATATARTLFAVANNPLAVWAKNIGPVDPN